jgi:hypothetical protein
MTTGGAKSLDDTHICSRKVALPLLTRQTGVSYLTSQEW